MGTPGHCRLTWLMDTQQAEELIRQFFAMENGNRVLPVDVLEDFAKDGTIGELYPYFYVTVGNSMPVDRAAMFGQEIAKEIKGKVDGVILTST